MQGSAVSNSRTSSHKTMAQVFDTLDAHQTCILKVLLKQCAMKLVHLSDGITFFGSITMNSANSRHEISVHFAIFYARAATAGFFLPGTNTLQTTNGTAVQQRWTVCLLSILPAYIETHSDPWCLRVIVCAKKYRAEHGRKSPR